MAEYAAFRTAFVEAQIYAAKYAAYAKLRELWTEKRTRAAELDGRRKDHKRTIPGETAPEPPPFDLKLETLAGVLRGEVLVQIHCYRADEMASLINVADEMGFVIRSFHHALEAYKIRDLLAARNIAVNTWADWWGFKLEAFDPKPKASVAPYDPRSVAQYLRSDPNAQTILISTNGRTTEGPFIAELALLEPQPTRFLVRSSKTIYRVNWDGEHYAARISSVPDLADFIDSSGIDAVVFFTGRSQHHRTDEALLALAIAGRPNDWALVPIDFPDDARVHRRITPSRTARPAVRVHMSSRLGEDLIIEPAAAPVSPQPPR
jgi:hypothetical protein